MKRFMLFAALLAMLGLSLAACGGEKKEASEENSENSSESSVEQESETNSEGGSESTSS
jgi:ABC-type glycerol-3-phosphate transport system substrate-binding protein